MKELYNEAKETIQDDGLMNRRATINLVNTIIRRKRLTISLKQIMFDFAINIWPCKRKPKFFYLNKENTSR